MATAQRAYGTAKLENILFTRELDRRYRDQGIAAVAFHPGTVATNFASESTFFMRFAFHTPFVRNLFTISAERSAMRLVWLAEGTPGTDWQPGGYYDRNRAARSSDQANDADLARALWDRSEVLLGREENPEVS